MDRWGPPTSVASVSGRGHVCNLPSRQTFMETAMRSFLGDHRGGAILLALGWVATLHAQPLHERIDQHIRAGHKEYEQRAAPVADDAEFLRRVYLDLVGRIPSVRETKAFFADGDAAKRTKVIDQLLASPEHARRLQQYFDVLWLDRRADAKVPRPAWEDFLRTSFAANKPYDQLVREVLSADGTDPKTRPAAKFFLERNLDPTQVTRDISRLFLGKNLQCAQCHDHPLVDDYKQEHYFGIQAFFHRAYLYPNAQAATAVIAEKAEGEVSFMSVFDKSKAQKTTAPKVLSLKPINDPKFDKGKEYKVPPAKDVKPIPAYSRLAQLAGAITATDNVAFKRSIANRLWAMMLGRGLVHPLDYDHSSNPASHPELLTLLADELAAKQFNINWLLREIALSKTYQRSSQTTTSPAEQLPDRFMIGQLRPLGPEPFGLSVLEATGYTDVVRNDLGKSLNDANLYAKLAPNITPFVRMFGTRAGEPEEGFLATLDQTLFLKHNAHLRNMISVRTGNLLERTSKATDLNQAVEDLYLSIYTRRPTAEERKDLLEVLQGASNRQALLSEVIWAMLASAEFRFNH